MLATGGKSAPEKDAVTSDLETYCQIERMLLARTYLFTLFHKVFGGRPSAELVDAICAPETIAALGAYSTSTEACSTLRLYCKTLSLSSIRGGFLLRASSEYTRLFDDSKPHCVIPRGSMLCGESMAHLFDSSEMLSFLKANGAKPRSTHSDCGDHVSLMCAFSAFQAQNALEQYRKGNFANARSLLETQLAFNQERLELWLPCFAEKLSRRGASILYSQMAEGLSAFIKIDSLFCAQTTRILAKLETAGSIEQHDFSESAFALETIEYVRPSGIERHEVCAV